MASSGVTVRTVPADYGELDRMYRPEIRSMVWKQLGAYAQPADVDDGVQYILQQCLRRRLIAEYKPGTVSSYNHRPVTFRAYLKANVALYCRGLRETLQRRSGRELLVVDTPVGEGEAGRWIDSLAGQVDDYPSLSDSEVLARLRDGLARRAPSAGAPSLVSIFDAMAARHADGRPMTAAAMRKELGAGTAAEAGAWLGDLRAALHEVATSLHTPVPPRYELAGLKLSIAEVRAAVKALKDTRGNRVLPAFENAGHPLAACGKDWYIAFARETMARYPECRVEKGGHFEGGHFGRVKAALIYGLERLVSDEPVPVVRDTERRAWAVLEAAVSRLPGVTPDKAGAILELARLVLAEDELAAA